MRVRFVMLLSLAVLAALPGNAALVNGRSYMEMSDWAAANGFRLHTRRGETLAYTNRAQTRIVLEKDSRTVQINGVEVAMCFPAAMDRGEMLVSQLDLTKTIAPLVFAPAGQKKITTICLDPGHGGKDTGNCVGGGFFRHNEKNCTLALAHELTAQLKAAGFNVVLTRTKDSFVELTERPDVANRRNADLFLSLHFNATVSGKSTVSGIETYCITPVGASSSNAEGKGANYGTTIGNRVESRSLLLAYQVQKALTRNLGAEDRGVRRARFAVLRDAEMPAILIEGGYMTHPVEGKKILDSAYRKQIAAGIVKGIVSYQKLTAPAAKPAVTANKVSATKQKQTPQNMTSRKGTKSQR